MYRKIQETTVWLKKHVDCQPQIGIILGTGLGSLADDIYSINEIPYQHIPNFPISTVEGHEGKLIFGKLAGKTVMVMKGRFHYYEGYSMKEVTFPVRIMYEMGVKTLFVSNAAGGANPSFHIGDLMIITDHINGFPDNPLRGQNIPTGPRFPDMHEAYDYELISLANKIIAEKNITGVVQGVYYGTQGPSYETPAEYRAFNILGGDAIGMSTVPEVIVAHHCGIKVFGVSVITNIELTDHPEVATHEEVQKASAKASQRIKLLVTSMIETL